MSVDWRRYCQRARYDVVGDHVTVTLEGGRTHSVSVVDDGDEWVFAALVSRRRVALDDHELRGSVWRRNRGLDLVGLSVDERGRVWARARVPMAGTAAKDFRLVLDAVAGEADRLEYALTGQDVE